MKNILQNYQKMSVKQFHNKNQFVITYKGNDSEIKAFQSFDTFIALYNCYTEQLYINWEMWDYSATTIKHLKMFINEHTKYSYTDKQTFIKLITTDNDIFLFNER